jgi:dTDP-4-dehydrorhamnose reductase
VVSVKVLIVGAKGQVGRALVAAAPAPAKVIALSHQDLDICDGHAVQACVERVTPDVIINAAAYTAVDDAENEVEAAKRGNEVGPLNLARATRTVSGRRLLHLSTNFVFDGRACRPYGPDCAGSPLSVYGRTKLDGERSVLVESGVRAVVIRTSWVYGASGHNFVSSMLKLMRERRAVRVVADQIGSPTSARSLADVLWRFAARADLSGIFHWSDAGVASWYDFAVAIAEEGAALGLVPPDVQVTPIAASEYPRPAERPAYGVLDQSATLAALGIPPTHWRANLREVLLELARA